MGNRLARRAAVASSVAAIGAAGSLFLSAPPSGADAPPLPSMSHCLAGLHKSASDSHFDVWTCGHTAAATAAAQKALDLATEKYAAETSLMGGPPRPDSGTPAEGGDKKIDIYLVSVSAGQEVSRYDPATRKVDTSDMDGADAETIPTDEKGTTASGWMVLDLDRLSSPGFQSDFVHEFFHLLQYRTNIGYCGKSEWWFTEASATWAESYFVPGTAADEVYSRYVDAFEKDPSLSLTSMAKDASGSPHGYASFIWPYFMQQQAGPDSIADVWKQLKGVTSCAAMNQVLDKVYSFAGNFEDFAVRNLDSPLASLNGSGTAWPDHFGPRYQELHSDFPETLPALAAPNKGNEPLQVPKALGKGAYPYRVSVPVKLPALSAQYNYFSFPLGDVGDVDFDFSGLSGKADVTLVGADNNGSHAGYIRLPVTGNSAHVCLTVDLNSPDQGGTYPNGGRMYVIVDNHSLTSPVTGSYKLTARADCANSVTGTLKDKTTLKINGSGSEPTEVDKWTDAVKVTLTDTWHGFDQGDTSETSTYHRVDTGSCTYTVSEKGTGVLTLAAYIYAFNAPAAAHGPYFQDFGGITEKGTAKGCGVSETATGQSAGFQYCQKAGQSRYGNTAESILTFNCSLTQHYSTGYESYVGSGTLHATDVDSCGLWTTDCSISTSAKILRR
jgi:hypothetical protein